jgi:hypothetical protein
VSRLKSWGYLKKPDFFEAEAFCHWPVPACLRRDGLPRGQPELPLTADHCTGNF